MTQGDVAVVVLDQQVDERHHRTIALQTGQRQRRFEPDPRRVVAKRSDQRVDGARNAELAELAERARRAFADPGIAVGQEGDQNLTDLRRRRRVSLAMPLHDSPDRVHAGQGRPGLVRRDLQQRGPTLVSTRDELELRLLTGAHVDVIEQRSQLVEVAMAKTLREQPPSRIDARVGTRRLVRDRDQRRVPVELPAAPPVGRVDAAVVAEDRVGRTGDRPLVDEDVEVDDSRAGTSILEGERLDEPPAARAVGEEKVVVVAFGQAESGIRERAGRSLPVGVVERREDPRRLRRVAARDLVVDAELVRQRGAGLPHRLAQPRPAGAGALHRQTPAVIAPLDHADDARDIPLVAVVVPGHQVAEPVERQILGIPQAGGEQLEVGAVGVHAEHGPPSCRPAPPLGRW